MFANVIDTQDSGKKIPNNPEQIWVKIKKGEKEALSLLYCMHYRLLFNYGYKMVPREELIKDCIQELFLTLWVRRETINEPHSVKSYLLCSMRRLVLRSLKKQQNQSERNRTWVEDFFEPTYTVEELIINFETGLEHRRQLREALQILSKRQKEVISLKYYDGLSNNEIADVMDINLQSVYNHVSEAIQKIQQYIY